MTNNLTPRQPKGIPVGGEWRAYERGEFTGDGLLPLDDRSEDQRWSDSLREVARTAEVDHETLVAQVADWRARNPELASGYIDNVADTFMDNGAPDQAAAEHFAREAAGLAYLNANGHGPLRNEFGESDDDDDDEDSVNTRATASMDRYAALVSAAGGNPDDVANAIRNPSEELEDAMRAFDRGEPGSFDVALSELGYVVEEDAPSDVANRSPRPTLEVVQGHRAAASIADSGERDVALDALRPSRRRYEATLNPPADQDGIDAYDAGVEGPLAEGTQMRFADIRDGRWDHAEMDRGSFEGSQMTRWMAEYSSFKHTAFDNADMTDSTIISSNLQRADLAKTTLDHATSSSSDFSRASFDEASMSRFNSTNSTFMYADFASASAPNSRWHRSDLEDARLSKSDFSGATFYKTSLREMQAFDSDLQGAVFEDCDFAGAHFENCDFTNTTFDPSNRGLDTATFVNCTGAPKGAGARP